MSKVFSLITLKKPNRKKFDTELQSEDKTINLTIEKGSVNNSVDMFAMDSVEHPIIAKYNNLLEGNSKSEMEDYYKQSISDLTPLNMTPQPGSKNKPRGAHSVGKNAYLFNNSLDDSTDIHNNFQHNDMDVDT
jgi:hypothetical protein